LPPKGTPSDNPAIGQLYNLSSDPFETKDLWDDRPEVVETLRRELQAIRRKDKSDEIRWQPGRKANALTEETNP
jgi:hypothetical protein